MDARSYYEKRLYLLRVTYAAALHKVATATEQERNSAVQKASKKEAKISKYENYLLFIIAIRDDGKFFSSFYETVKRELRCLEESYEDESSRRQERMARLRQKMQKREWCLSLTSDEGEFFYSSVSEKFENLRAVVSDCEGLVDAIFKSPYLRHEILLCPLIRKLAFFIRDKRHVLTFSVHLTAHERNDVRMEISQMNSLIDRIRTWTRAHSGTFSEGLEPGVSVVRATTCPSSALQEDVHTRGSLNSDYLTLEGFCLDCL